MWANFSWFALLVLEKMIFVLTWVSIHGGDLNNLDPAPSVWMSHGCLILTDHQKITGATYHLSTPEPAAQESQINQMQRLILEINKQETKSQINWYWVVYY